MTRRGTLPRQRFDRHGFLAIDPRAFFELFAVPVTRENTRVGPVDIIEVSGPLVQRDEMWCDSYESIRARMREACASDSSAIVLRIDSPGGDASGCFETARALRADAAAVGKPLYAYIDGACSAAYALATAASAIVIGESCAAGSVGVLSSRPDQTLANMQHGLRMAFVTSGARKLDGNPDHPISDAEIAETQRHVDDLAAKFFALIAEHRPQLPAAQVAGYDGAVFYGVGAVEAGLADNVSTFENLLALASTGGNVTIFSAKSDYETALASLEKVAKGKDANASAARKALAALSAAGPGEEDEPEPETEPEPDEEPKPEGAGDPPPPAAATPPPAVAPGAESADEPPQSAATPPPAAAGASTELQLAARIHRLEAAAEARATADERASLLAQRPDFDATMRAVLARAPIATVREFVKTLPRKKVSKPAAITTVAAAQGSTQGPRTIVSSAETLEMDRAMGLTVQKLGCKHEGNALILGGVVSDALPESKPPTAAAVTPAQH